MERERFTQPNPESSDDSSKEKKDDKKTKKAKSASDLAKLLTRDETVKPPTAKPEAGKEKAGRQADEKNETVDDSTEPDKATPLEELSPDEQAEAAQMVVAEHLQNVQASAEEVETTEDQAVTAYLEALQQRLEQASDDEAVEDILDEVYDDTSADFTSETDELPIDQPAAEEPPVRLQVPTELPADQPIRLASVGHSAGLPSYESLSPTQTFVGQSESSLLGRGHRNVAAERSDDTVPRWEAMRHERYAQNRGLMVGGIVGYLVGRRRGRIKTEKRLHVIQAKLEKQVVNLEQQITGKEMAIRRLAREKTAESSPNVTATLVAASEVVRPPSQQASFERAEQPDAEQASVSASRAEQSPEVSATAEKSSSTAEAATEQAATPSKLETARLAVDSLPKTELLALSGQIRVGETNLRRVYEAQLVDEHGLRRLIKEYQAGHDVRRALAREFLAKELKFERDPSLRDLLPPEAPPRRTAANKQTSVQDAGTATAGLPGKGSDSDQPKPSVAAPSSVAGSSPRPSKSVRRQTEVSPHLLIGLTITTVGLAIYALWLTLTR